MEFEPIGKIAEPQCVPWEDYLLVFLGTESPISSTLSIAAGVPGKIQPLYFLSRDNGRADKGGGRNVQYIVVTEKIPVKQIYHRGLGG